MSIIKCPKCGKEFPDALVVCPGCGFNPFSGEISALPQHSPKKKSKIITGILCFFLWPLGMHEFYLGNVKKGLLCLAAGAIIVIISSLVPIMSGLSTLIAIIWSIKIFTMSDSAFDAKYNNPNLPRSKAGCLIGIAILSFLLLLFISIMVALSLPYFDFVKKLQNEEKLTSAVGVDLVNDITSSQQRHYLRVDTFAANFQDLDIDLLYKDGNTVKTGNSFATKDFTISMKGSGDGAYVEATRNGEDYNYVIRKYYISNKMQCISDDSPENKSACKNIGLSEK